MAATVQEGRRADSRRPANHIPTRLDEGWRIVDAAGHEHRWVGIELPSLEWVVDKTYWCRGPPSPYLRLDSAVSLPVSRGRPPRRLAVRLPSVVSGAAATSPGAPPLSHRPPAANILTCCEEGSICGAFEAQPRRRRLRKGRFDGVGGLNFSWPTGSARIPFERWFEEGTMVMLALCAGHRTSTAETSRRILQREVRRNETAEVLNVGVSVDDGPEVAHNSEHRRSDRVTPNVAGCRSQARRPWSPGRRPPVGAVEGHAGEATPHSVGQRVGQVVQVPLTALRRERCASPLSCAPTC